MSPLYATSIMYAVGEFLDSCVIQECGLFDDFLSWAHVDFISPFSSGWTGPNKRGSHSSTNRANDPIDW